MGNFPTPNLPAAQPGYINQGNKFLAAIQRFAVAVGVLQDENMAFKLGDKTVLVRQSFSPSNNIEVIVSGDPASLFAEDFEGFPSDELILKLRILCN